MKKLFAILLLALILPMISAIDISVEDVEIQTIIIGHDKPIQIDLKVTNNGSSNTFRVYNLLGFNMEVEPTHIKRDKSATISLTIFPREKMDIRGKYNFQYYIKGQDDSEQKESFLIDILEIQDAFEVGSEDVDIESNTLEIYIKNKANFNFDKIDAKFTSDFFELEEEISLGPYEKTTFEVELKNTEITKLVAGFYTIQAEVDSLGQEGVVEGTLRFVEKDKLVTEEKSYGWIVDTQIIEKENVGNTVVVSESSVSRNIISRMFTSVSPEPDTTERKGMKVTYTWINELKPGASIEIAVKTNWAFPVIIIALIVAIFYIVKNYFHSDVTIQKRVSYVKTKGGEFAIKIKVFVKAQKYIERINLIEKVPGMLKVYPSFHGEQPIKVDDEHKRINWRFEKMESGEIRSFTYVLYSKVGVLGRFALPKTKAVYERNNEISQASSNRCFFISKTRLLN